MSWARDGSAARFNPEPAAQCQFWRLVRCTFARPDNAAWWLLSSAVAIVSLVAWERPTTNKRSVSIGREGQPEYVLVAYGTWVVHADKAAMRALGL